MFDGLNALPWHDLTHAYGSAEEVPMWLRQLASRDKHIQEDARHHLSASICHQGWICPATAYAVPYLLEVLQEPGVQVKKEIFELLVDIATAYPELHEERWRKNSRIPEWNVPEYIPFKDARLEVSNGLPVYVALLEDSDPDMRMQAANILRYAATLTPDLRTRLSALLRSEPERNVRANLVILLGELSQPGPEAQAFFTDMVRTGEDDLILCECLYPTGDVFAT